MAYVVLSDFKYGLDKRRMELTTPDSALLQCKNAMINRGGEIEVAKDFVEKYNLPEGDTFGLHFVADNLYVFGSGAEPIGLPPNILYQRLQHPDDEDMIGIVSTENFNGKIYAIAEYADGSKQHFYNGVHVDDWNTLNTVAESNNDIAEVFRTRVNATDDFTATRIGSVVTITGQNGVDYAISGTAENFGSVDDQTLTIIKTQDSSVATPEVLATATFQVTAGSSGAGNEVTSITVDGVNIFAALGAVAWTTSDSNTASLIAAQINSATSTPNYTATADGEEVTISAVAGSGATPNGFVVIANTDGDVEIDEQSGAVTCDPMAGGAAAIVDAPEINTVTIGGTFESADVFTLVLAGVTYQVSGTTGGAGKEATITLKNKLYCTTASLLFFSEVGNPNLWGSNNGAGFINMSNQDAGSEVLTALGIYQSNLVVFSKKSTQIWFVDPDPELNLQVQVILNTGCIAADSVQSFGDNDMFFLSESGIRSIRSRSTTNVAGVSDVGTLIDDMIIADLNLLTPTQIERAKAIIEPYDGRYWIAIGTKIYVFTYFPSAKISAWSTLETGLEIDELTVKDGRIYLRSGDDIYLYGGDDNDEYTTNEVVVELPFVNARTIASWKSWTGIDAIVEGVWKIAFCTDYNDTTNYNEAAVITGSTIDLADVNVIGDATAIKFKLTRKNVGTNGKISAIIMHYENDESPA